jgi:2-dehydro-3-deoxyphosphooctonate aldolase (KDO 8-P synthase)
MTEPVIVGRGGGIKVATFDNNRRFALIAGPCLLESTYLAEAVADKLKRITDDLRIDFVFKASLEKANRTDAGSPRRGMDWGTALRVLDDIRTRFAVPVTTDVHHPGQVTDELRAVVDLIQIPALLSRQTELIEAAGAGDHAVSIKKGQWMDGGDMARAAEKVRHGNVLAIERGNFFGYHELVVDFRNLVAMKSAGLQVVFDATHATQHPSAKGRSSGGNWSMARPLALAAAAVGVAGIFMETHPEPQKALSDRDCMVPLDYMHTLLARLVDIDAAAKESAS